MTQPWRRLLSSFNLSKWTLIKHFRLFNGSLGWCAGTFIGSIYTIWIRVSTNLYILSRMYDFKERKTQVLSLRLWNCYLTPHMAVRYWIAAYTVKKFLNDKKAQHVIFSSVLSTFLFNWTKLIWWGLKLSTEYHWMLDFSFWRKVSRDCSNFITFRSKSFVILTSMKNLKRIKNLSTWKNSQKTSLSKEKETTGTRCT